MKILVICAPNHTVIGGGEKYIRKVIDVGKKNGHEFHEIHTYDTYEKPENLKCPSQLIKSFIGKLSENNLFLKVIDYKIKMFKINVFLRKCNFDLIIVNTSILSLKKKYLDKCIFIQQEDIQLYEKFANHFYYRWFNICSIALKSKNIVCNTPNSVKRFKKIDTWFIRNYFIVNLFVENFNNIIAKPERVVYLGRICKEKGVDEIVKIAKFLNEPIHLYGIGPYKIEEDKNIILHGSVKPEDLETVFGNAKLNILLSKSEGLPFSIIEGFSYGVPCLLIDASTNAKYLVDNGNNGILCNKNADRKTIIDAINNFDSLNFSSTNIKKFCFDNFQYKTFEEKWESILTLYNK